MKVQKSAQHYLEAAYDEIDILLKVARNVRNATWIDSCLKYHEGTEQYSKLLESGPQR